MGTIAGIEDGSVAGEEIIERIVEVLTAVSDVAVAGFDLEFGSGGVSVGTDNVSNAVVGQIVVSNGVGFEVIFAADIESGVATEYAAEGVESEGYLVVGEGVVVGFPENHVGNSVSFGESVFNESFADGPGLGVGVVGIVVAATAEVGGLVGALSVGEVEATAFARGEDATTDVGENTLEHRSSSLTTIAEPEDVGDVVAVFFEVVFVGVPGAVGFAAVVSVTRLNEGAGVVHGAADDGAVGSNCKFVELDGVEALVHGSIITEIAGCIDTAVGGDEEEDSSFGEIFNGDDGVDARVAEERQGVALVHVVAAVEFAFGVGDFVPLVVGAFDEAFAYPNASATYEYAFVVLRVNGECAVVPTGIFDGERSDGGGS